MLAIELLAKLGFLTTKHVEHRNSIYDLFHNISNIGIYVLHFSNNTYYVGQSIDIPRRFSEHKKVHQDITKISFKSCNRSDLNFEEAKTIAEFEKFFSIRNIALASYPDTISALSIIFPEDRQNEWLYATKYSSSNVRQTDSVLRAKFNQKYQLLIKNHFFHDRILAVMKKYVSLCIPEKFLTEISFWGCSCLPSGGKDTSLIKVFSRINIYWQEVFTVGKSRANSFPIFNWHLEKSVFDSLPDKEWVRRYDKFKSLSFDDHFYKTGGSDQFRINICDTSEALDLLDDNIFIDSAKRFNLRLMRKGPLNFAQFHCMDLSDILLDPS